MQAQELREIEELEVFGAMEIAPKKKSDRQILKDDVQSFDGKKDGFDDHITAIKLYYKNHIGI